MNCYGYINFDREGPVKNGIELPESMVGLTH
jgi:hypothetical protein